jgi:hypothetical protein
MSTREARRIIVTFSLSIGMAACGMEGDLTDDSAVTAGDELQYTYVNVLGAQFAIGGLGDDALMRATGVIKSNQGTCGITFISKHYGITAGHCTDGGPNPLPVASYQTTNLTAAKIFTHATVDKSAGWPNWRVPTPLTSGDGYVLNGAVGCFKVRDCRTASLLNCPTTTNTDIAMLHCPSRSGARAGWVRVWREFENREPIGTRVRVRWYHEIVNLSTVAGNSQDWLHYGKYDSTTHLTENFHYTYNHQMVPLDTNVGSVKSFVTGSGNGQASTPSCHGTSGSGALAPVFSTYYLLGPIVTMTDAGSVLCQNPSNSNNLTNYVNSERTRAFGLLPEVQQDRF